MIIVIGIIATMACGVVVIFFQGDCNLDFVADISSTLMKVALTITVIMILAAVIDNIGIEGYAASLQAERDSLVYQLENDIYENDNDLGKSELYANITKWNKTVAEGKALQYDTFVGIFYPDIYDRFELIELG